MPFRGKGKDEMSKNIKRIVKLLVAGLIGLLIFCVVKPMEAQASELYFDEDGNLYFHTRDKKATGGTKYKTIGWVIKRYDMPMNASGQQYVMVTKTTYKEDMVDPSNSKYVYCYFKSDKDEILDAVRTISIDWYNQLYYFGDDVYIDSVMTVVQNGVEKGSLSKGGVCSGEVYCTYEGIAGARKWSSPESLRGHFDMKVAMPALIRPMKSSMDVIAVSDMEKNNKNIYSFIIGDTGYGQEKYDLNQGVPSGENLYLKGMAEKRLYKITLQRVRGSYRVLVPVPIEYTLKWTDYNGVARTEKKKVYRYYDVFRTFALFTCKEMEVYSLKGVRLYGDILDGGEQNISIELDEPNICISEDRSVIFPYTQVSVVDGGVVTSDKKGIKPSIPMTEYRSLAEDAVGTALVSNDLVMINGKTIVSNEISKNEGKSIEYIGSVEQVNIYDDNIWIPEEARNITYEGNRVELFYESNLGNSKTYTYTNLPNITVHTPVVCDGSIKSDIDEINESDIYSVVPGRQCTFIFNYSGMHRDIKGYGYNNYLAYIAKRRVCFGFPVEYKGVRYEAGTWIEVDQSVLDLIVCEDTDFGEYEIILEAWANNMLPEDNARLEYEANLAPENYGAYKILKVKVQGYKANMQVSGTH